MTLLRLDSIQVTTTAMKRQLQGNHRPGMHETMYSHNNDTVEKDSKIDDKIWDQTEKWKHCTYMYNMKFKNMNQGKG